MINLDSALSITVSARKKEGQQNSITITAAQNLILNLFGTKCIIIFPGAKRVCYACVAYY
jgi:hypothetical protein